MKELVKPVLEQDEDVLVQALCEPNGDCGIQCFISKNSALEEEEDILF
jgi:hypothetical protein